MLIWWEGASRFKSNPFISLEVYTKQHWLFSFQHLCIIDLLSNTISLGKFLIPLWGFCLVKGKKSKGMKHSNCVLGGFDNVPGYRMSEVFMVSSFSKGSLAKKWVGWECCVNAGTRHGVCHCLPLAPAELTSSELFSFTEIDDQLFEGWGFLFEPEWNSMLLSVCWMIF